MASLGQVCILSIHSINANKSPLQSAKGPPYLPTTAGIGGLPTKNVDDPISAVFLVLFVIGAASHMTIWVRPTGLVAKLTRSSDPASSFLHLRILAKPALAAPIAGEANGRIPTRTLGNSAAIRGALTGLRATRRERIGVTSQNAAKIHCLMLFFGQNHFALEPFPRDSRVRPAIDLAMG